MQRVVLAIVLGVMGLVGAVAATPAFGDSSGTVTATVSASAPCLTVSTTSLTFPTTKFSTASLNGLSSLPSGPTVTNCSGAPANITGSASSATNSGATATWFATAATLGGTTNMCATGGSLLPTNKYALGLRFASDNEPTLTTNTLLKAAVGTTASLPAYELELFMPCTTSDGAGTVMSFQITFTASLP